MLGLVQPTSCVFVCTPTNFLCVCVYTNQPPVCLSVHQLAVIEVVHQFELCDVCLSSIQCHVSLAFIHKHSLYSCPAFNTHTHIKCTLANHFPLLLTLCTNERKSYTVFVHRHDHHHRSRYYHYHFIIFELLSLLYNDLICSRPDILFFVVVVFFIFYR